MAAHRGLVLSSLDLVLNGRLNAYGAALNADLIRRISCNTTRDRALNYLPIRASRDLPIAIRMVYLISINMNLTRMARANPRLSILNGRMT